MSSVLLWSYLAVSFAVIVLVYFLIRGKVTKVVQTKEEKKEQIIQSYRQELQKALSSLEDDQDSKKAIKTQLLQRFNKELASNIFFDNSEIHQIILELSKEG